MLTERQMFNRDQRCFYLLHKSKYGERAILISKKVNIFRHVSIAFWFVIGGIIRLDVYDRCPVQYIQPAYLQRKTITG